MKFRKRAKGFRKKNEWTNENADIFLEGKTTRLRNQATRSSSKCVCVCFCGCVCLRECCGLLDGIKRRRVGWGRGLLFVTAQIAFGWTKESLECNSISSYKGSTNLTHYWKKLAFFGLKSGLMHHCLTMNLVPMLRYANWFQLLLYQMKKWSFPPSTYLLLSLTLFHLIAHVDWWWLH